MLTDIQLKNAKPGEKVYKLPDSGGLYVLVSATGKVEDRGAIETAHRIRQRASCVFAYAAAAGLRTGDPAAVVKPLMKPKARQSSQPALIKLDQVGSLSPMSRQSGLAPSRSWRTA